MSFLTILILSPILWAISIPLTLLASFTTTLAFSTLFVRALIVYVELAVALVQNQFVPEKAPDGTSFPSKLALPSPAGSKHARRKSRRGSAASSASNGSATPKAPSRPSSGLGIYGGQGVTRDFEGVGGWRIPGPDDDDIPWMNMNSRLELPTMVEGRQRNHHRSRTSGSLASIPLPTKSPASSSQARTPTSIRAPGTTSPEEYFGHRVSSKSTTALDAANIGKALLRLHPSHSLGSSGSSAQALQMAHSNS